MSDLPRPDAAAAAHTHGWHYLLGAFRTSVPVGSIAEAATVLALAADATDGSDHLRAHAVGDRVDLSLQPPASGVVTRYDVDLAAAITSALRANGHDPDASAGRPVQSLEIAIDAMDIPAVRPFWQAVLGYVADPADPAALVDPLREGPTVWFQQMDAPRRQRNRIHFDITVPHAVAEQRIAAAVEAGGHVVSDARAKAFWILADPEGNEICVCTWQDRD
jgi:4a-hydroxytetrahydrobiopterin dehydratase